MSEEKKIMIEITVSELEALSCAGQHGPLRRLREEARAALEALEALKPPSVESKLEELRAPWSISASTGDVLDREKHQLTEDSCRDQDRTIVNAPDAFALLRESITVVEGGVSTNERECLASRIEALLKRAGWL